MGMPAVIVYRNTAGEVFTTTDNWSTRIGADLDGCIEAMVAARGISRHDAATEIFSEITSYGHLPMSASLTPSDAVDAEGRFTVAGWERDEVITSPVYRDGAEMDLATVVATHPGAGDGWSAWFDESAPNAIHTWISPDHRDTGIAHLNAEVPVAA